MSAFVNLLLELERLKRLDRTGWLLRGLPGGTESVAAHSFGVGVTAMLLADELVERGIQIDTERLLRIALLHDWAEVRVGDMPRTATSYFGKETRKQAETMAFGDMVQATRRQEYYTDLFNDYEQRRTLESRLVKAADTIDLLVEALALERVGFRGLNEFWAAADKPDFQLEGVALQFVEEVFQSLVNARSEIC